MAEAISPIEFIDEVVNEVVNAEKQKERRGRKIGSILTPWRYREDGTYDKSPLLKNEYHKNYYYNSSKYKLEYLF